MHLERPSDILLACDETIDVKTSKKTRKDLYSTIIGREPNVRFLSKNVTLHR